MQSVTLKTMNTKRIALQPDPSLEISTALCNHISIFVVSWRFLSFLKVPEAEASPSCTLGYGLTPILVYEIRKGSAVFSHRAPCYQGLEKGHKNQCLQKLMIVNVCIFAMMIHSTKHSPQSV